MGLRWPCQIVWQLQGGIERPWSHFLPFPKLQLLLLCVECVCVRTSSNVSMHIYGYMNLCVHMCYLCMRMYMYLWIYMHVCVFMCIFIYYKHVYLCIHVCFCLCMYMHVYLCVCLCMFVYVYECIHAYVHMCVCLCICVDVCICGFINVCVCLFFRCYPFWALKWVLSLTKNLLTHSCWLVKEPPEILLSLAPQYWDCRLHTAVAGCHPGHGSLRLNLGPHMCELSMRWDPCMVRVCLLLSLLPSAPCRWNNVGGPLIQHHWGLLSRTLARIYDACCHCVTFSGPAL